MLSTRNVYQFIPGNTMQFSGALSFRFNEIELFVSWKALPVGSPAATCKAVAHFTFSSCVVEELIILEIQFECQNKNFAGGETCVSRTHRSFVRRRPASSDYHVVFRRPVSEPGMAWGGTFSLCLADRCAVCSLVSMAAW